MSGPSNGDDLPRAAEVPLKIADAVKRIGTSLGPRVPVPNDKTAAAAIDYFVANEVKKAAEVRCVAAREVLNAALKVPDVKGKHEVHRSAHCTVIVDNREQPRRLHEQTLLSVLCKRFDLSVTAAQAAIDEAKVKSDGYQQHVTVALK